MTLMPVPKLLTRPRKRDVAFLLFGAGVFLFSITAVTTICVVCAHPATVSAIG